MREEIVVGITKVLNKKSVLLRKITLVFVKKMYLIQFIIFISLLWKSFIIFQPFMFRWKDCKGWLHFTEFFMSVGRGVDIRMQALRFEKESCFELFLSSCWHYSKNFYWWLRTYNRELVLPHSHFIIFHFHSSVDSFSFFMVITFPHFLLQIIDNSNICY